MTPSNVTALVLVLWLSAVPAVAQEVLTLEGAVRDALATMPRCERRMPQR